MTEIRAPEVPEAANDDLLRQEGFTEPALTRYSATVNDYAQQLREKAVFIAESHRSRDAKREVTEQAVRAAAASLALTFGRPAAPKWVPLSMAGEFLATGVLGYATGDLAHRIGFALFSAIAGLLLLFLRLSKGHAE